VKRGARRCRTGLLVVALGAVTGFAACELNPQPLPPQDRAEAEFGDAGSTFDSGRGTSMMADSAPPGPSGSDAGDAGEAGDAGDAGRDADAQ
jgi:hypothetical protein